MRLDVKRPTEDFTAFAHGGQAISAQGVFSGRDLFDIETPTVIFDEQGNGALPVGESHLQADGNGLTVFFGIAEPSCIIR